MKRATEKNVETQLKAVRTSMGRLQKSRAHFNELGTRSWKGNESEQKAATDEINTQMRAAMEALTTATIAMTSLKEVCAKADKTISLTSV